MITDVTEQDYKYITDGNKWRMLLAYQRGYLKATEDQAAREYYDGE